MAVFGIDFGTTNTVVSLVDRGSFPVVQHSIQTRIGRVNHEVFPSTIYYSKRTGRLVYGLEAERLAQQMPFGEGIEIRSLKRFLSHYVDRMEFGETERFKVKDLLVGFLQALRRSIEGSGLFGKGETFQSIITWPAHSNGAQRAITREAFHEAGFDVIGTINEPTAAAIEYADRATGGNPRQARIFRERVAIFDFGGGTFDASLLSIEKGVDVLIEAASILHKRDVKYRLRVVGMGLEAQRLKLQVNS
jgi:molecular chaperone DnaK (HSP70)